MHYAGRVLVVLGVLLVAAGAYLLLGGKADWIGRLPGDLTLKRGNITFYFPVATCVVVSVVLSLILWLLRR